MLKIKEEDGRSKSRGAAAAGVLRDEMESKMV